MAGKEIFMNNEEFRNDQNRENFDENAFYQSEEPKAEDISGVVENLSKPRSMIYSVVSLISGIVAVLICCCGGWFGLGLGALAIAFSVISRRHLGYFDGLAVAGLVLGICGAVFGGATVVLGFLADSGILNAYLEQLISDLEAEAGGSLTPDAF